MCWGGEREVWKEGRNLLVPPWESGHFSYSQWELTAAISENQTVLLSARQEQLLFSEEQTLNSIVLQYFGLKILVYVEKNGQGN